MTPSFRPLFRFFIVGLAAGLAACQGIAPADRAGEAATTRHFERIRTDRPALEAFLRRFPKGGDLHNHLSGAVPAESYLSWAAADGLCVDQTGFVLSPPPCEGAKGQLPVAEAARQPGFTGRAVDALSMRNFVAGGESGHDHFFATFGKFGAATKGRTGDMLAEVASQAAADSVSYLELMVSAGAGEARKLGARIGWDDDWIRLKDKLEAAGLPAATAAARAQLDEAEARMRQILACDTPAARPGCRVTLRYQAEVIRIYPPEQVFAQTVLAYDLVKADPRVAGINFVAPEDHPVSLRDYATHMRILGFLGASEPSVPVALHAGELAPGLVPPEDLRSHVRQAVEVAKARRIGHGVDILHEDDPAGLMRLMADRRTVVEINLTSNDIILQVRGPDHPFPAYRRAGVPLVLSTDDEGVSRIDLSHEYRRAVETYGLDYRDIKGLARNSLEYAFLPGASLWTEPGSAITVGACAGGPPGVEVPPAACRDFLAGSEKARAQWRLEADFTRFEGDPH